MDKIVRESRPSFCIVCIVVSFRHPPTTSTNYYYYKSTLICIDGLIMVVVRGSVVTQ